MSKVIEIESRAKALEEIERWMQCQTEALGRCGERLEGFEAVELALSVSLSQMVSLMQLGRLLIALWMLNQ